MNVKQFVRNLSVKQIVYTCITVLSLFFFAVITIWCNAKIEALPDQQAAKRWDAEGDAAQVSCFFAENVTVDAFMLMSFERELTQRLTEILPKEQTATENGRRLLVDAYSSMGNITITSEKGMLDQVNAVGVGSDFFLFHPLLLKSGQYFSGDDLMKDSVILDEDAAWQLFGSYDIAGQSVMIGNVPHFVAGVIERPSGKFAESAGLNKSIVFVSQETLSTYGTGGRISCYEVVAPNPVKNFVTNAIKEKLGVAEADMVVVENSSRYDVESMIPVLFDFGTRSMQNAAVRFPYWENIGRGFEDVRALILLLQFIFLCIPVIMILRYLIIKWKNRKGDIMKTKLFSRMFPVLVLTVFMMSGLTGCGKGGSSEAGTDYKNHVYRVEDLVTGEEANYINQILRAGDELYTSSYEWQEDGRASYLTFSKLNEDGSMEEKGRIVMDQYNNIMNLSMDAQANLYCINNVYGQVEGTEEYEDAYYLEKRTLNGEVLFSVKLNDIPQIMEAAGDYFYISGMVLQEEQGIYLNVMGMLAKFDMAGNFQKMIGASDENGNNIFTNANFLPLPDGRCLALLYEDTGVYFAQADLENGTLGEKYEIPGNSYEYAFYPGISYDLYLASNQGIFGYHLGDTELTQLMSYIDSDCAFYNVYNLVELSETEFLGMYGSFETNSNALARFTKVPPEEVKEKQVITLACVYMDMDVNRAVVKFNKENEDYRIVIQNYNSLYGDDQDYNAGMNRLNTDIVSGKVPDILIIDNEMPADSYISKGLFEDLKPYIENDEEMGLEDFMPNIIDAYSVDGKLYRLVPHYTIQTVVAKSSEVGKERGWTVAEAVALWDLKPEGTEFVPSINREGMLRNCIAFSSSQFINWKTGECNFNSDGFIEMLDFIKRFPEAVDDIAYSDEYWENYDTMWRDGRAIAMVSSFSDFRNFNYIEKGNFGEDITLIGFPSADEDGSAIVANLQFAMSAKSKHKDGAWQFLRQFLMDEYQEHAWGYPISIKRLDAMGEAAMEKPWYEDENGNRIEYNDSYYMAGVEIVIDPMTAEEVEEFKQILYTIDDVYVYDENLLNIIKEETAAYFSGQKQARDVANVIQSRVQIYVNETR